MAQHPHDPAQPHGHSHAHEHEHDHDHGHDHHQGGSPRRLITAFLITASFMLVEVAAGLWTGSLALLADAGHMLTDAAALALAIWAVQMTRKPADTARSYGYHRMQVLAAFVNGLSLLLIAAWIVFEAVQRLWAPAPILTGPMLAVAITGLFVNIAAFAVLHGGDQQDLNLRGATAHVLADMLGSAAAILAALIMMQTGWWLADPLLSLVTAVLIARSGLNVTRRSAHVLLEGAPESLDNSAVRDALMGSIAAVQDVHHIHSWSLKPGMPLITLHAQIAGDADADATLLAIHQTQQQLFNCEHATVQMEIGGCPDHA